MATIILRLFGFFWYICLFGVVIPASMVVVSTTLDQEIANLLSWQFHWNWYLLTIGFLAMLAGLALVAWSSYTLHRAGKAYPWSVGSHVAFNPHQLVTSGPYAIVRHPMTTSYLLFLVGIAFIVPSPVMLLWLIPLTAGLFYEYLEYTEEVNLKRWFGQEYELYHHNTPSLIPRLWPRRPAALKPKKSNKLQFEVMVEQGYEPDKTPIKPKLKATANPQSDKPKKVSSKKTTTSTKRRSTKRKSQSVTKESL